MNLNRRSFAVAGATLLGVSLSGRAYGDTPASIRAIALAASGRGVRVSLELDRAAQARCFFLTDPDRFVVDVAGAQWRLGEAVTGAGPGSGLVRGYRYAQRPDGAARLVLDLQAPASITRQSLGARQPELSFDLEAAGAFVPTVPLERAGRLPDRKTIVIDAGHGGRDPGAIGVTGVREKDVVLDAALKLREALSQSGRYDVALTRDDDTFLPVEERVRFARSRGADLFISLHADSHASPDAEGASVYTLSERGADRAQTLVQTQNWDIDLGEAPRRGLVTDILLDLTQRETTNRSSAFAESAIREIGEVSPLLRNTHRNAGFFVLLAPDVPAVLIETGFLSNLSDERRLNDPRARQAIAGAIAGAIDSYFAAPRLYAAAG